MAKCTFSCVRLWIQSSAYKRKIREKTKTISVVECWLSKFQALGSVPNLVLTMGGWALAADWASAVGGLGSSTHKQLKLREALEIEPSLAATKAGWKQLKRSLVIVSM